MPAAGQRGDRSSSGEDSVIQEPITTPHQLSFAKEEFVCATHLEDPDDVHYGFVVRVQCGDDPSVVINGQPIDHPLAPKPKAPRWWITIVDRDGDAHDLHFHSYTWTGASLGRMTKSAQAAMTAAMQRIARRRGEASIGSNAEYIQAMFSLDARAAVARDWIERNRNARRQETEA